MTVTDEKILLPVVGLFLAKWAEGSKNQEAVRIYNNIYLHQRGVPQIEESDVNKCPKCRGLSYCSIDLREPKNPTPFHDLTSREIKSIFNFMFAQRRLNLTMQSEATLSSNYIFSMELILSKKKHIKYRHHKKLARKALVTVFFGGKTNPIVAEYCVKLSPRPRFCGRPRFIPFHFRPFTNPEFSLAIEILKEEAERLVGDILLESFEATLLNCGDRCLDIETAVPYAAVASGVRGENFRGIWFPFFQSRRPSLLNPVDFVVLVLINGTATPQTADVWYNGQLFDSLQAFKDAWQTGTVNKLHVCFPLNPHPIKVFPPHPQRPPVQVEPDGKRYSIKGQSVHYMNWDFQFGVSPTHGPQLYKIKYKNDLIVYELGLSEITVFYSSAEPIGRFANFFDTVVLIGTDIQTLVPGVDCPTHATFADSTFMSESSDVPIIRRNSVCVYEHNTGIPLRRHYVADDYPSGYYEGAPNTALVLRMIFTLVNYDYIFDFIFYHNGAMETKVLTSGIALPSYVQNTCKYGFQMNRQSTGLLHQHMFNFKVDVDIGGTKNSYTTYDIREESVPNQFSKSPETWYQTRIVKVNYTTEREAAFRYNFSEPKYHVFYNEKNRDKFGNPRAYRLLLRGVAKSMFKEGEGNEPGASWMRYQLAVTKRKEKERYSSSKYATYDGEDSVVNFENFIGDESIVQEDLVAWVTLGVHHIPHTDEVPNQQTVGGDVSFFLLPFNYFIKDPSLGIRDGVEIFYDDPKGPLKIKSNMEEVDCVPMRKYTVEDLAADPEEFLPRPIDD
ncbi:putative amine oxidase [copper-containing] [Saccostrea echinata]|uniref:putative amine oxidase [copper-containing] n=1 Tax=Saccostrea echinata TaxID=191078 RepID=UPI002A81DC0A|nr:putative amine oxidase [copper-containing] [Saccostrea echinata]